MRKIIPKRIILIFHFIDFPDLEELHAVQERCKSAELPPPHYCTLLSSLFRTTDDVTNWVSRLKVSTYERELALFLVSNKSGETTPPHPAKERPYQFMVIDMARSTKANFSQEYVLELLKYRGDAHTYRDVEFGFAPEIGVHVHVYIRVLIKIQIFLSFVHEESIFDEPPSTG